MNKYKNLSKKSSVDSYIYTNSDITVKFTDGKSYLYSILKNTPEEIKRMRKFADLGYGLGAMLATKPYHIHDSKW